MSDMRIELRSGYSISRMIKGGWQLAGGHGTFDWRNAIADMFTFEDRGMTTFDCADIYTGVEEMIGGAVSQLRQRESINVDEVIQIHTKLVPDLDSLTHVNHNDLERADYMPLLQRVFDSTRA